jgi:hypothetical protein
MYLKLGPAELAPRVTGETPGFVCCLEPSLCGESRLRILGHEENDNVCVGV